MTEHALLWQRLDLPGHEAAWLTTGDLAQCLKGAAVFGYERQPVRLEYRIVCDAAWQTRSARVGGWIGSRRIDCEVLVDMSGEWRFNGRVCPELYGCHDLDLNFSPSTNLLPIRRLNLAIGQAADVRAAWLRFPTFELEPLDQTYRRLDTHAYRYESAGGNFVAELQVNSAGFVTEYPQFWKAATPLAE